MRHCKSLYMDMDLKILCGVRIFAYWILQTVWVWKKAHIKGKCTRGTGSIDQKRLILVIYYWSVQYSLHLYIMPSVPLLKANVLAMLEPKVVVWGRGVDTLIRISQLMCNLQLWSILQKIQFLPFEFLNWLFSKRSFFRYKIQNPQFIGYINIKTLCRGWMIYQRNSVHSWITEMVLNIEAQLRSLL